MKKILVISVSLLMLSGCATLIRGTTDTAHFRSEPKGASVELDNGFSCSKTPCSITVPRKINAWATFELEGCEDKTASVRGETSGDGMLLFLGNIILGGLIGIIVDVVTGAHNDVTPNPIEVKLDC